MLAHGLRTARRQLHVVGVRPPDVGVAFDADGHGGARLEHAGDLVEQREAPRLDAGLVRVEEDLLLELDLLLGDHDVLELLRAAVVVGRPRLVRALVRHVEHAVLVVVRIGTAIGVLEPVLVLRIIRALVDRVEDPVRVVVGIRAAVGVLEPVLVLRLVRALVDRIENPVLVVVGIGAAVGVLEPVLVLRLVRALVDIVENAVVIAVARGGRRRALVARRQAESRARVAVGDLDVVARAEVVALIQLSLGELDVRLRQGQLARRALVGAIVPRLLGDAAHLVDVGFELHARTARGAERGEQDQRPRQGRPRSDRRETDPPRHSGAVFPARSRARCLAAAVAGSSSAAPGSSFWLFGLYLAAASPSFASRSTVIARAWLASSSARRPYSMASPYSACPASSRALCRYSSAAVYSYGA